MIGCLLAVVGCGSEDSGGTSDPTGGSSDLGGGTSAAGANAAAGSLATGGAATSAGTGSGGTTTPTAGVPGAGGSGATGGSSVGGSDGSGGNANGGGNASGGNAGGGGVVPNPACTSPAPAGSPVSRFGQLKVVGTQLQDSTGHPVQLKGVSSYWLNWENTRYAESKSALQYMRDNWKLTAIRAAMGTDASAGYLTSTANQTALQTRVETISACSARPRSTRLRRTTS